MKNKLYMPKNVRGANISELEKSEKLLADGELSGPTDVNVRVPRWDRDYIRLRVADAGLKYSMNRREK